MKKSKLRISVFGNPLVEKDSLPLKILPKLRQRFPDIEFVIEDPTETLNPPKDVWWIIDSAEGIDDVVVIDDISKLELSNRVSVHDYDLAFDLKLLLKLKKLNKIKIIAVPMKINEKIAFQKILSIIKASGFSESEWRRRCKGRRLG